MARTQLTPTPPEITTVNLSRLLARLEQKLPPTTSLNNTTSQGPLPNFVERRKIAANLEYARQLLLQLETEYATIKNSVHRKKVQEELGRRKVEIRRLNERLHVVEQLESAMEEEEEEDGEEEIKKVAEEQKRKDKSPEPTTTLRKRFAHTTEPAATSTATPSTTTTATTISTTTPLPAPSTTAKPTNPADLESSLAVHKRQQDVLTTDLLQMSRMLKESSLQFGKHLEDEKPLLEQAAAGLDKNVLGMQSTGGKLDQMRKDGSVGWYRTMMNMAIILGLGIAGLVILLLPKLRM